MIDQEALARTPDERLADVDDDAITEIWADLGALHRIATQLNEDQRWIETALGDRNSLTIDGRRMTKDEYWQWRQQANVARVQKTNAYRRVKTRINEIEHERRRPDRDHSHNWKPLTIREVAHPTTSEPVDAVLQACHCGRVVYVEVGPVTEDDWVPAGEPLP